MISIAFGVECIYSVRDLTSNTITFAPADPRLVATRRREFQQQEIFKHEAHQIVVSRPEIRLF